MNLQTRLAKLEKKVEISPFKIAPTIPTEAEIFELLLWEMGIFHEVDFNFLDDGQIEELWAFLEELFALGSNPTLGQISTKAQNFQKVVNRWKGEDTNVN